MQLRDGVFPNRPPTKTDLVSACGSALIAAINASDVEHWNWAAVGVVGVVFVVGPLAQTPLGRRVGSAFRELGVAGRAVVLAFGLVAMVALLSVPPAPSETIFNVIFGALIGVPVYVFVHLLVARDIGGWHPD